MIPRDEPVVFNGARVVLPDGVHSVSVRIEAGQISGLDVAEGGARVVNARGMILAPAMIDIHGDAFERQIMPRPGVTVPIDTALLETDRQLAANGIATAYHALTLSWEPGLRSVATGWQVHDALLALAPRLTVENRLQLRWETFCSEALPLIDAALAGPLTPAIAFNDHTTIALLHPDVPLQHKPFDLSPDLRLTDIDSPAFASKMAGRALRSRLTAPEFVDLIRTVWQRRPEVPGWIDAIAAKGRAAGAPMLSHDDTQDETRRFYHEKGAKISEFPMNAATAAFAHAQGDAIVLGAPNAARGGSHLGSVGAAGMIAAGLCDILASDYYYPALLSAVARLMADQVGRLETLWPLVSANPARALGLNDRGQIAPGLRADLVLIDWPEGQAPSIRQTWVSGNLAYAGVPTKTARQN
ncbi:MAG: alpha-D-ribose 1-methylphosphonate 5-triphosphate diphosphatase [Paracoccaceae bacterium]